MQISHLVLELQQLFHMWIISPQLIWLKQYQ